MSLYDVRKQLNMTQVEFSAACGISVRSIQAYEQGRKLKPPTAHLIAFNLSKYTDINKSFKIIPTHCANFDGRCFCSTYLYFLNQIMKRGETACQEKK